MTEDGCSDTYQNEEEDEEDEDDEEEENDDEIAKNAEE